MARVVRLEGTRSERVRVVLDDDRSLVVPPEAVERLELAAGTELDEAAVAELCARERRREAMDRALDYLSHRSRTRRELERYLARKGYEEPIVAGVLARCEELGYVDDMEFAASFVRDRIRLKPRGTFRLKAELRRKGVDPDVAERAVARAFEEEGVTERDLLERAAEKRWRSRRTDDPSVLRRRLYGYLKRRGFPGFGIREVVDDLLARGEGSREE